MQKTMHSLIGPMNSDATHDEDRCDVISIARNELLRAHVQEAIDAHSAVVLERIARGGGNTNWYYRRGPGDLDSLVAHLKPDAKVSFYFDDRIHNSESIEDARRAADLLLREKGEALIGSLAADGLTVAMSIVVNVADLSEYISETGPSSLYFYGSFPCPDNDSCSAITVVLPDADGIVRAHPH